MNIKIIILPLLVLFILTSVLSAQQTITPKWDSWDFLLGEWTGEGGGDPGKGVGGFSFYYDLQKTILIRKNYSEYPATENKPAFRHDDFMVIYQENKSTRATYWDNEGHVINYTVEFTEDTNSVIFISDIIPSSPRFRLIYTKQHENTVCITFEIAPPEKPDAFSKYIEAVAHRK